MAYSVLGTSLPQLAISGYASPAASWSGPLTVTVDIANIGASSILEPLALDPGNPITPGDVPPTSTADARASVVGVFASKNPEFKGAVEVGTIAVPPLGQNSELHFSQTIALPPRPAGFPGDGGKIYIALEADATGAIYQTKPGHAISKPVVVTIVAPLPELRTVGLDLPPVMQPGDTVQANARITNIGTADTGPQGFVQVALVASTTRSFTSGSSIVALATVPANFPPISRIATSSRLLGDANQTPPANVVTVPFPVATLPKTPRTYFLGVVIDPFKHLKQLSGVSNEATFNRFELIREVGPPIRHLPPAGVLINGGRANVPVYPNPFGGHPVGGPLGGVFPAAGTTTPIVTQPFPIITTPQPIFRG